MNARAPVRVFVCPGSVAHSPKRVHARDPRHGVCIEAVRVTWHTAGLQVWFCARASSHQKGRKIVLIYTARASPSDFCRVCLSWRLSVALALQRGCEIVICTVAIGDTERHHHQNTATAVSLCYVTLIFERKQNRSTQPALGETMLRPGHGKVSRARHTHTKKTDTLHVCSAS